jgi:hypothetical protein
MDEDLIELMKGADPQKAVAMLQQLRNDSELAGDLPGAQLYTQAIALVMQGSGEAKEEEAEPVAEAAEGDPAVDPAADPAAVAQSQKVGNIRKIGEKSPVAVRKAGRTFSAPNSAAMHDVIKALAGMLAGAGDEVAAKVAACYGPPAAEAPKEDPMAAEKIAKMYGAAIAEALNPTINDLNKALATIDTRIEKLERQPAAGGPVLRPVAKVLPGQSAPSAAPAQLGHSMSDLRRLAATEPNAQLRAQYVSQLKVAEGQK